MQDTFKLIREGHEVDLLKLGVVIQCQVPKVWLAVKWEPSQLSLHSLNLLLLIIYNIFIISVLENVLPYSYSEYGYF